MIYDLLLLLKHLVIQKEEGTPITKKQLLFLLAIVTTGLITGVFYTFSVAINPGLSALSDANYIAAMNSIIKVIQNPAFFFSFLGAAVFLPLAAYQYKDDSKSPKYKLLMMASLLYIVGGFGVTMGANIPLNDKLSTVNVQGASAAELASARDNYEGAWDKWHMVRTVASSVALVMVAIACTVPDNKIQATNQKEK